MSVDGQNQVLKRRWRRRARRLLITVVPAVVWVLAVVAAFQLYRRVGVIGTVTGFADDRAVTLAHLEPGVVRDIYVQLYDQVVRGQMLLSMDDRLERILLDAIEKDIERLRAEVVAEKARLCADNARATADVDDLARRFAIDRETAHIDYLTQLAADARDRILLRGAMVEYEIVRNLHDQGSATFRELNDVQTEMDSLQAAIAKNTEVLEQKKSAFNEADRRWSRYMEHAQVATAYEPVLVPLRLAVDVRERDLQEIVRRIDAHVLRAPIDGQVTTLAARVGDHVQAGSLLVLISPTSTNRVVAYLPEPAALSARVGAPVSVNCLAGADDRRREYPGTIVSLSATVNEAPPRFRQIPTYPMWGRGLVVALSDDVRLIPGERVTISLSDTR